MIGYRRFSFHQAISLLTTVRTDPGDMQTLLELQLLLVDEITLAENRIREAKANSNADSGERLQYFHSRARGHQQAVYYWKTIGDSIAHLYCDRFALKHVYYCVENFNVRSDSGFISDSSGFQLELFFLRKSLDNGLPAVLCDLTNTIRYGDLCFLIDDDPKIIEIKSSNTKSRRRNRQLRNLKKLESFYQSSGPISFRGFPLVQRVALKDQLVTFEVEFNSCIDAAYENGYSVRSPEPGVWYLAISDADRGTVDDAFREVHAEKPWVCTLNGEKQNRVWAPYRPFSLLIRSKKALYDFVLGRLFLITVLDLAEIERLVQEMGWTPKIDTESPYLVEASRDLGEQVKISEDFLKRSFLEALSLSWIVKESLEKIDEVALSLTDTHN